MGAHSDHGEKCGNRAKDRVYWCGTRGVLGEVQDIDGGIQGGDNLAQALPSLGAVCHGRDAGSYEEVVRGEGCGGEPIILGSSQRCAGYELARRGH